MRPAKRARRSSSLFVAFTVGIAGCALTPDASSDDAALGAGDADGAPYRSGDHLGAGPNIDAGDAALSDASDALLDPACPSKGWSSIADEYNFEWMWPSINGGGERLTMRESQSRQWRSFYSWTSEYPWTGGFTWPWSPAGRYGFTPYTLYGPWIFDATLTLNAPCNVDNDCRPIVVRMSSSRLLTTDELQPLYDTKEKQDMVHCLPVGPYQSSVCAIPCDVDAHCDDYVRGKRTNAVQPTTSAASTCDDVDGFADKARCVTDLATTLRCTRHAVRHHRAGPCSRSHPTFGTCPGTLRCLLEGQPPYCDAPEPSADGCLGRTPPPPPPAPCPDSITADDGYFGKLGPCGGWPDYQPLCSVSGDPCAKGQLCVPLPGGRRCLHVATAAFDGWPPTGCWPHLPSASQVGGDWVLLPGTLPNALTATDALEAYDFRLDWQAARGVPCRNDADCKLPITSPFGKTVWLQGATRCAEETPGAGGTCQKPCDIPTHGLCHQGTACAQGPGGWRWCMPVEKSPTCSALAAQLWKEFGAGQRPCSKANPYGTCPGKAVCANAGAPPVCDATEPKAEACGDGSDQDCDGQTDEGCGP